MELENIGEPLSCPSHEELVRLRLAVEASGEVIFMTDAGGTITYVNPEFVRLYGYAPSEIVGRTTPRILKSGVSTAEDYASFWQQLLNKQVVKRDFINRTKAGALVQIEGSANPIFSNDELIGFLAVQRDVTERKATEAALRESEARYRTLADAAQDSIFIVDRNARIEYANAMCVKRFGVHTAEAIGRQLQDVFGPMAAQEMWRELATVFATGERQYVEARFDTLAGELWLGTWLVPMSCGTTGADTVMGVARDITDRKRLERQFAQAQKMEAIGRLAGGIAHDFNNLLTAILGYSELVLDRLQNDADTVADLQEVKKAGERASRLTRQLLAFSRRQALSPQVLDLNEVLSELRKMLDRIIGEDVHLDIVTARDLKYTKADASQIEQVIVNLAVNARDAMPQGGTLRIATANADIDDDFARAHDGAVPGRYVSLTVQDTGCGITPEVLAHVFEPFFTTKVPGKGTGLGLSTVYGIVKQSGGYISIDSARGVGTTVTTFLPVVETAPTRHAAERADAVEHLSRGETVLVVEDDPGLRRLMTRTLEQRGYSLLIAMDVNHAIEIAARHQGSVDLLLSDVVMPLMNGPDLAQRIICTRTNIKVLYVSGYVSQALNGSTSSRAAFLAKPFSPQALAKKVRECLDSAVEEA